MKKDQKKKFVKNFKDTLDNVGILVVTHYSGLRTTQTDELRIKIKEEWYFTNGSRTAAAIPSQPPTYPTQLSPRSNTRVQ